MAWHVTGNMIELCSCKVLCPCWLGPAQPDQGWCSGAIVFDIQQGAADGVDLSGAKVVFAADWPGDFWAGNGTARLYLDAAANAAQRRELEAIFSGRKGGLLEPLFAAVITQWLPAQTAPIALQRGATLAITVGHVGHVTVQPLQDQAGQPTMVQGGGAHAPGRAWRLGSVEWSRLVSQNAHEGAGIAAKQKRRGQSVLGGAKPYNP